MSGSTAELAWLRERVAELEAENAWLRELAEPPDALFMLAKQLHLKLWAVPALRLFMTHTYISTERLSGLRDEQWASSHRYGYSAVHHIRRALAPLGIQIKTIWGWGYQIEKKHQERIRQLVDDVQKSVDHVDIGDGAGKPVKPPKADAIL